MDLRNSLANVAGASQFESMAEAEHFIQKVESEHREGKATTFLKSRKISFVQLLERYILQEGPKRPVPWESASLAIDRLYSRPKLYLLFQRRDEEIKSLDYFM